MNKHNVNPYSKYFSKKSILREIDRELYIKELESKRKQYKQLLEEENRKAAERKAEAERRRIEAEKAEAEKEEAEKEEAKRNSEIQNNETVDQSVEQTPVAKSEEEQDVTIQQESWQEKDEVPFYLLPKQNLNSEESKRSIKEILTPNFDDLSKYKYTIPEQNIENGNAPGIYDELVEKQPVSAYSANAQKEFYKQQIDLAANQEFDGYINELTAKKQQVNEKLDYAYNKMREGTLGMSPNPWNEEYNLLNQLLDDINRDLKKVLTQKARYIQNAQRMSFPENIFLDLVSSMLTSSDDFVNIQKDYDDKFNAVKAFLESNPTFKFGPFESTNLSSAEYKKLVSEFSSAKIKKDEYGNKYSKLLEYINILGYLPKKIDDLPEQYRSIAKSAFTKDGKLLIEDDLFRSLFYENSIVDKEQLPAVLKAAKQLSTTPELLGEDYINQKIQEIEILKENYMMLNQSVDKKGVGVGSGVIGDNTATQYYREIGNYDTTKNLLEGALTHKKLNDEILNNRQNDHDVKNAYIAFKKFFWDDAKNTFSFDYDNVKHKWRYLNAASKLQNGEKLTDSEKDLLGALMINDAYSSEYGDYKDVKAFKWSSIAAESLMYMAGFIATGGVAASLEKGAAKSALKYGGKSLLKTAAKKIESGAMFDKALQTVEKYGAAAGYKLYQGAMRLGADATYAAFLENTLGLPKVALDAMNDIGGQVNGQFDVYGNPQVDEIKNQKDVLSAIARSETRNWIENFSEMMGEWGIGKALYTAGKYMGLKNFLGAIEQGYQRNMVKDIVTTAEQYLKHGPSQINSTFAKFGLGRFIPRPSLIFNTKVLKAGRFHGFLGEVSEEYYGIGLQHLFGVLDDENKSLLQDVRDQTQDIFGGIAVSTGILGALGMAGAIRSQIKYENAVSNLENAFGKQNAFEIRRALTFANPMDFFNVLNKLTESYGKADVRSKAQTIKDFIKRSDIDKSTALAEYANALLQYRGAIYGEEQVSKLMDRNNRNIVLNARKQGYRLANYRSLNTMNQVVSILENDANDVEANGKSVKDVFDEHGNDVTNVINGINDGSIKINDNETKDSAIKKYIAYWNALHFRDGVDLGTWDLADERALRRARIANRLVNKKDGLIHQLYKPILNEDGSDTGKNEHLYWIDGELITELTGDTVETNETSYDKNKSKKILVANSRGEFKYIDRSELDGWHINHKTFESPKLFRSLYLGEMDEETKERESYLKSIGINPMMGNKVYVGDKILTILDANGKNGITYSLSDENGENAQIYHADTIKDFEDFKKQAEAEENKNVTQFFIDNASEEADKAKVVDLIVLGLMAYNKQRSEFLLQEYNKQNRRIEKSLERDWEMSGVSDEIDAGLLSELKKEETKDLLTSEQIQPKQPTEIRTEQPKKEPTIAENPDDEKDSELENLKKIREERKTLLNDSEVLVNDTSVPLTQELKDEIDNHNAVVRQIKADVEHGALIEKYNIDELSRAALNLRSLIEQQSDAYKNENNTKQDAELDNIVNEIRNSQESKKATTGFHYIKNIDGKLVLARRIHSVIGDRLENLAVNQFEKQRADEYYDRLKSIRSISELRKAIDKILQEIKEEDAQEKSKDSFRGGLSQDRINTHIADIKFALNIESYAEYLQQEDANFDEVIYGISRILARGEINPSVIAGNLYDTIARYFLDYRTKVLDYNDPRLTTYIHGEEKHISDTIVSKDGENVPLVTKEAFDAICAELAEIKKYFEETLKWKLVCQDGFNLCSRVIYNGSVIYVAGETDCIAIDENGRRLLIDFKTFFLKSKQFFDQEYSNGLITESQFFLQSTPNELRQESYIDESGNPVAKYSNAVQYARQLTGYKILAQSLGIPFESSYVLLFGIDYEFRPLQLATLDKQNVSHSVLRVQDKNNTDEQIPNLVNLDVTDGQDEDVKKFVAELQNSLQRYLEDETQNLITIVNQFNPVSVDDEIYDILPQEIKDSINDLNQRMFMALVAVANNAVLFPEVFKSDIERIREQIDNIQQRVNTFLLEREQRINDEKTIRDILFGSAPSIGTIEEGILIQMGNVISSIFEVSDVSTGKINKDQLTESFILALMDDATKLGLWIKLAHVSNQQIDAKLLKQANTYFNAIVENILSKEDAEIVKNNVLENKIQYVETENDVDLDVRSYLQITGLIDHAESFGDKTVDKSIGDKGTKLTSVIHFGNFVNTATFYVSRSLEHADDRYPLFEITIVYNGETFSPIVMNFAHKQKALEDGTELSDSASKLYSLLCKLTEVDKSAKIKLNNKAISRSNGLIDVVQYQPVSLLFLKEFAGISDWKDVQFSNNQNQFGLTVTESINGIPYTVVKIPGRNEGTRSTVYVYTGRNENTTPPKGGIVMLYRPKYDEINQEELNQFSQNCVPINLVSSNFTKDVAKLVWDILQGKYSEDQEDILSSPFVQNGIEYPFRNIEVINLFIGVNDNKSGKKKHPVTLFTDTGDSDTIGIRGVFSDLENNLIISDDVAFYSKTFNLKTDYGKRSFIKFLCDHVRMQIYEDVLNSGLGEMSSEFLLGALSDWFDEHEDINEIVLGGVKLFDRSDIDDNINGLAWYMKTGRLQTNFNGMRHPLFSIDEENAIDTTPPPLPPNLGGQASNELSNNVDDNDFSAFFNDAPESSGRDSSGALTKTVYTYPEDDLIDEAAARLIIKDILGDIYVDGFEKDVLDVTENGYVVARCYLDWIEFSKHAKTGTAYHEAFHRVLELLVSDKTREKAYKAYRKKYGQDLSDKEIAEKAADEFWWYKDHKPDKFKFSWNVKDMFNQLGRWYKFFTNVGSFTLYRLYKSAEAGKFRNLKPNEEAIKRWKRLTGEKGYMPAIYEYDGLEFNHIMNQKQLDAVLNTIRMIILSEETYENERVGQKFDPTGKTFNSITPDLIRNSPITRQILTSPNISVEGKLRLAEILGFRKVDGKPQTVRGALEKLLPSIVLDLKKYQMASSIVNSSEEPAVLAVDTDITDNKTRADKTVDDPNFDEEELTEYQEFGQYSKISAEYDPITRATPRVKFFFSVLTDVEEVLVKDTNGKIYIDYKQRLNEAGLPQNVEVKEAWGKILNMIYQCRSVYELYNKLQLLSEMNSQYSPIFRKYDALLKRAFKEQANGTIFTEDGKKERLTGEGGNYTKEQEDAYGLIYEITATINHYKSIPLVAQSMQNSKDPDLSNSVRVMEASLDYLTKEWRASWSDLLTSGQNQYIGKDDSGNYFIKNGYNDGTFNNLAEWFTQFVNLFNKEDIFRNAKGTRIISILYKLYDLDENGKLTNNFTVVTRGGNSQKIDLNDSTQLKLLKLLFIEKLNSLGIGITILDLEYELVTRHGGNDLAAMLSFFEEFGKHINGAFNDTIKSIPVYIKNKDSKLLEHIWNNEGAKINSNKKWMYFIDAICKARYNRISQERMMRYLTIAGKAQYAMTEQNFITDRLIDVTNYESKTRTQLLNDPYFSKSKFLRWCANNPEKAEEFFFNPLPGFKTDIAGSSGIEYLDLSEQEDVVVKYGMLAANEIILPTLSDKTTYGGISGNSAFKLVGINYISEYAESESENSTLLSPKSYKYRSKSNDVIELKFDTTVLNQFIDYAQSEYESVKREVERLKYQTKDRNSADYTEPVENLDNTRSFELNGKKYMVHQCARFATFTGIFREDGTFVSFNKRIKGSGENVDYCSESDCLEIAEREFFNKSSKEKREMMARILSHQLRNELDYLYNLGMIERDKNGLYKNKNLDRVKINRIQKIFTKENEATLSKEQIHNDSVIAYVADMVCKQQMSMQESFRIFSIDPRAYAWEYDDLGNLVNTTRDLFKRLGGLVSTGTHNVEDCDEVPDDIVCAEMHDTKYVSEMFDDFYEKAKHQELVKHLRQLLYSLHTVSGGLSVPITIDNEALYKKDVDEINRKLESMSDLLIENEIIRLNVDLRIGELKDRGIKIISLKLRDEINLDARLQLDELKSVISQQNSKFKDLNCTDGATFISDEFCEMLLRMIGKWDSEISQAFELLRNAGKEGNKSNEDLRSIAEAYNKIYTTVIGTQKYTAYGHRVQTVSYTNEIGKQVKYDRLITFFDKTAYFPIFNCMATGHMKAVLKKMQDLGIHVLKTSSAIKVGGCGAVDCNDDVFQSWDNDPEAFEKFKFKTYTLPTKSIRKQFNTDPKGKEYMPLGTQYVKVLLSLILAGQTYDVDGKQLSAADVRTMVMTAINNITNAGYKEHIKKFYNKNGELNLESFLNILKKQLADKDANDPILRSLKIEEYTVTEDVYDEKSKTIKSVSSKKKRFVLPVAAMGSTSWIESIVASIINKDIVNITTPGSAFYQRSVWGSEGMMKMNYINEDDWDYTINHGAKLKEINEEGSMDCVLSIDFFDYLFKDHPGLMNLSFRAKEAWLIKHGIISGFGAKEETFIVEKGDVYKIDGLQITITDENDSRIGTEVTAIRWHNATSNIVGYRIPTQAVSSIHAMRCVGVICAIRDTIILPREITAVTGSDFDIDKFFLSTLYYDYRIPEDIYANVNEVIKNAGFKSEHELIKAYQKAKSSKNQELEKKYRDALNTIKTLWSKNGYLDSDYNFDKTGYEHNANKLLKLQINLLKTTGNNISQLHGSIDVDTEPLKAIAKEINKKYPVEALKPFDMTSMKTNVYAKMSFAIGKKGIGPYALNNNNHVLTMLYGVKYISEKDGILDLLDLRDLSKQFDRNNHSILSWLSGLINAHVDVAKDPYIRSLGVNSYTYNLVSLLIRTGYGAETFWFTTQPIMQKFYKAYDTASGVYHQDENISVNTRTKIEIENTFLNFVNENFKDYDALANAKHKDQVIKSFDLYLKNKYGISTNDAIRFIMKYKQGVLVMKEISTTPDQQLDMNKKYLIGIMGAQADEKVELTLAEIQTVIAIAHYKLQTKAELLSKLVQYTKIDTKKHGKTIVEQNAYLKNFRDLTDKDKSPFEYESIQNMINNSFIKLKTELAISATTNLMSSLLILATPGYQSILNDVKQHLHSDRIDEKFSLSVAKMIIGKLKADYFFKGKDCYCIKRGISPVKLLVGPTSIYDQLMKIRAGIANKNDASYNSVRDAKTGECNNYLLNQLINFRVNDKNQLYEIDPLMDARTRQIIQSYYNSEDWVNAKFIKLQNLTEDSIKSADVSNAWRDLLNNSENKELRIFAEQLIVYSFLTSAASGGKYDIFKFVPPEWMTGDCFVLQHTIDKKTDSFGSYMNRLLDALQKPETTPTFSENELDQMVLNFAWDDNIVPVQNEARISNMAYLFNGGHLNSYFEHPLIFGAIEITNNTFRLLHEEDKYPQFIKIKNSLVFAGQHKYDIYKVVTIAQTRNEQTGNSYTYPIYAMIQPNGGVYSGGQKIFSIDLQQKANLKSDFFNYWQYYVSTFINKVPNKNSIKSPVDLMNQLMYLKTSTNQEDQESLRIILDTIIRGTSGLDSLGQMLNDITSYQNAINQTDPFLSIEERQIVNQQSDNEWIKQIDFHKEATELNLDQLDPIVRNNDTITYTKMSESDANNFFGAEKISALRSFGLHLEFYKMHHELEEDGKTYKFYNPVITLSLNDQKRKGFFLINVDVDYKQKDKPLSGTYAVHFKTYVPQMENDTKYASVELSEGNKLLLMRSIIYLLPEGGRLSTYGSLTNGGLAALNTLSKYSNSVSGYIIKVGEREVTSRDGLTQMIPIWGKSEKYAAYYEGNKLTETPLEKEVKDADEAKELIFPNEFKLKEDKYAEDDIRLYLDNIADQLAAKLVMTNNYANPNPYTILNIMRKIINDNEQMKSALMSLTSEESINQMEDYVFLADALFLIRKELLLLDAMEDATKECYTQFKS